MTLRVVGAGVGRTGTKSLSIAVAKLFDSPCYHMTEVFAHPEHIAPWHAAARGAMPDWNELFSGYAAAVDWPASAFWCELSVAFPDALVVLSLRDADTWWESADQTILPAVRAQPQDGPPFMQARISSRYSWSQTRGQPVSHRARAAHFLTWNRFYPLNLRPFIIHIVSGVITP